MAVCADKPLAVPGDAPGRYPRRAGRVAPVVRGRRIDLPGRPKKRHVRDIHIVERIHEILVRQENHRRLVAFRDIERFCGKEKGAFDRPGREYGPREFPVSGIQRKIQVALLGPGRHSRRGAGTLRKVNDQRRLHDSRKTDPLAHQRESAS
ncbi:hypothetical protein SDC9_152162 [bioreactor metagenome]|uniref:Uncharacterized protein n=1 Tax=bioreactor metagenome TaxID=1076179 RepID=A0A645EWT2_9ZZZZ